MNLEFQRDALQISYFGVQGFARYYISFNQQAVILKQILKNTRTLQSHRSTSHQNSFFTEHPLLADFKEQIYI